tara:strand:- start:812 stop:1030 length:219 start_codon:yes stop_codon:yes gene_type:complete
MTSRRTLDDEYLLSRRSLMAKDSYWWAKEFNSLEAKGFCPDVKNMLDHLDYIQFTLREAQKLNQVRKETVDD